MINIGAEGSSQSGPLELRSPARTPGLSPCSERSWRRVRPLGFLGEGEFLGLRLIARIEPAEALRNKAVSRIPLGQVTRHCVPSRFDANLLKTNDRRTCYPTLEKGGRPSRFLTRRRSFFQPSGQLSPLRPDFRFSIFHFPVAIPESRRSRPASDSLSGGII
jgi:hypothetical protein